MLLREIMATESAWEWATFEEPVSMPAPGMEAGINTATA